MIEIGNVAKFRTNNYVRSKRYLFSNRFIQGIIFGFMVIFKFNYWYEKLK